MVSGFIICRNEEELLQYCLESFASLGDLLDVLSVVDNNSTDATLDILRGWSTKLPIILQHEAGHAHHGKLRELALSKCKPESAWIYYLDADETHSLGMPEFFRGGRAEKSDIWEAQKWSTISDRFHHAGGEGPAQRIFRNLPGVRFPQSVHTEPTHPQLQRKALIPNVYLFDATSCKSEEALWEKGIRYAWAQRENVPGVGPFHEYTGRVEYARQHNTIRELPEEVKRLVFTGP